MDGCHRRRWHGWTAWALVALPALAGGCCSRGPVAKIPIPIPVVDVHTHLFNARDLPLEGILNALGVPEDVAGSLAAVVKWWTPEDGARGVDDTPPGLAPDDLRQVTALIRATMTASRGLGPGGTLFPPLSEQQRARLFDYAGAPPAARELGSTPSATPEEAEVEAVARALARAQFPPGDTHPDVATPGARGLSDLRGYLRFLGVITRGHAAAARQMTDRQYPQVWLFAHHMMDMAAAYAGAPSVPFDRQWQAMTQLDAGAGGKLVHFVAYDPFRRGDSLEYVSRGLADGAIGVKFYPPSGYGAAGNVVEQKPPGNGGDARRWESRYGGGAHPLDGAAIDKLNDALFQYCETHDVPIFTHCTSSGFQAAKDYGLKSDPKYWVAALEKHPKLRLCFGHAGGDTYWFSKPGDAAGDQAFGAGVVDLCLKYDNVYCEAGYLEEVLDPARRDAFKARLASVIGRRSLDGRWQFGDKFMYGTDWFMISKERHPETYLVDFWNVFQEDAALKPWSRRFFGRNAVAFLNLARVADSAGTPFTAKQRDYWKKLVAAANAE
jgi:predicted TIM-barrel fold metal-dependent hydrolase